MISITDREPLICPKCKKPTTPAEIRLNPSSESSFYDLEPVGQAECLACGHMWLIHDMIYLDAKGKVTVGKEN